MASEGKIQMILLLCGQQEARTISLIDNSPLAREWVVGNVASEARTGDSSWFTADLLETPVGWALRKDSIPEIVEGVSYYLAAYTDAAANFSVRFTLSDLADLGDNEVWAGTQQGAKAMSRSEFEERALAGCN